MFICKFHRKPEDLAAARVPRSYHFFMVSNQNHSFGHIGRRRREAIWSGAWVVLVVGTEHVKHFWLGKIAHLNVLTFVYLLVAAGPSSCLGVLCLVLINKLFLVCFRVPQCSHPRSEWYAEWILKSHFIKKHDDSISFWLRIRSTMPHGPPVMKVDGVLYNDTDPIGQQPSPFCLDGPGGKFFPRTSGAPARGPGKSGNRVMIHVPGQNCWFSEEESRIRKLVASLTTEMFFQRACAAYFCF